jgi:hypothetical protein
MPSVWGCFLCYHKQGCKDLRGYTIQAADGGIGKVDDFYFDDQTWTVRYLVAETGKWLVDWEVSDG